ncbi:MAG: hypothetical protein IPK69_11765 [Phycisphaerales bacterium]|nr:MAG: hypothetical protein IPK69_11765 [Phycisphaerales bacterium]
MDKHRTLCSACDRWASRADRRGHTEPSKVPVYGLWIIDGGPKGKGHWLVDMYDDADRNFPAIFWSKKDAETAAKKERENGLDVVALELRAVAKTGGVR